MKLNIKKIASIGFLVLMLANPVLGAVQIDGLTAQNGLNELKKNAPIYDPMMNMLFIVFGLVVILGAFAMLKCGGASFLGMTIGTPHSAADGIIGMVSCIGMALALGAGIAMYLLWM